MGRAVSATSYRNVASVQTVLVAYRFHPTHAWRIGSWARLLTNERPPTIAGEGPRRLACTTLSPQRAVLCMTARLAADAAIGIVGCADIQTRIGRIGRGLTFHDDVTQEVHGLIAHLEGALADLAE